MLKLRAIFCLFRCGLCMLWFSVVVRALLSYHTGGYLITSWRVSCSWSEFRVFGGLFGSKATCYENLGFSRVIWGNDHFGRNFNRSLCTFSDCLLIYIIKLVSLNPPMQYVLRVLI